MEPSDERGISETKGKPINSSSDIQLEESVVYVLSGQLGGRQSVIEAPFNELLAHLITHFKQKEDEAYQKEVDYFMDFISRLHSNPSDQKQQKQVERFIKEIQPQSRKTLESEKEKGKYQWPERVQKKIEAKQRANQEGT